MREISREDYARSRFVDNRRTQKKRKHSSSEKQSVRAAAQEFLEKAARELLGSNDCEVQGPLRNEISDEGGDECLG